MRLRAAEISTRTIGDETIVLNLATSRYFTVTGVGTAVFDLLVEGATLDELVGRVVEEYEVDRETAGRDLAAFIDRLRDARLLA